MPAAACPLTLQEEYEDEEEAELLGDDEAEDDPDFTPGDAEEEEEDDDDEDDDDDEQLDLISDTNAPYAEATSESKGKRRGEPCQVSAWFDGFMPVQVPVD